jgi:NhaP-type Na+/H+ or K+/H+ antiporter
MVDLLNMTSIVAQVSSLGMSNFIAFVVVLFSIVVGGYLLFDFMHNKHIETLEKQNTEITSMAIQHIAQMVSMAIASTQGMDITDTVLKVKNPEPEKKQ